MNGQAGQPSADQGAQSPIQFRDLGLTLRTVNVLARAGVQTVAQLCELQVAELAHIPGIGMTSVQLVVAGLARHGLALRAGGAPYGHVHAKKLIQRYSRFQLDSAPEPFPTPADVDATRTAAMLDGIAGTPLGDRLHFIARQLAAMLPDVASAPPKPAQRSQPTQPTPGGRPTRDGDRLTSWDDGGAAAFSPDYGRRTGAG